MTACYLCADGTDPKTGKWTWQRENSSAVSLRRQEGTAMNVVELAVEGAPPRLLLSTYPVLSTPYTEVTESSHI